MKTHINTFDSKRWCCRSSIGAFIFAVSVIFAFATFPAYAQSGKLGDGNCVSHQRDSVVISCGRLVGTAGKYRVTRGGELDARQNTQAVVEDGGKAVARAGSHVVAYRGSHVQAEKGSLVVARFGSRVEAHNGSRIEAHSGSSVDAGDGSITVANEGSAVTAQQGAMVMNCGGKIEKKTGAKIYPCAPPVT